MKQNARSDKTFNLNAHVRERFELRVHYDKNRKKGLLTPYFIAVGGT